MFIGLSVSASAFFEAEDARLRKPLPGQSTAVIYLRVTNHFTSEAKLLSAQLVHTSVSADEGVSLPEPVIEVHEHRHVDGMMSMRRVSDLSIAAGRSVAFVPGGYHLMVFGLTSVAEPLQLLLRFSDGRQLQVPLRIESI
jgi:copper(I)-binding protein